MTDVDRRRINRLTYLLTLYNARHPLYTVKLKNKITNNGNQRSKIDIYTLALIMF